MGIYRALFNTFRNDSISTVVINGSLQAFNPTNTTNFIKPFIAIYWLPAFLSHN